MKIVNRHSRAPAKRAAHRRKVRRRRRTGPVHLTVAQILAWADEHAQRTGRWPTVRSGEIENSGRMTWDGVDNALSRGRAGRRGGLQGGLRGSRSLAQLLARHRGKTPNRTLLGPSTDEILKWADAFHARHRRWPRKVDPRVAGMKWSWTAINHMIRRNGCGIEGVHTLAQLLARMRGKRNVKQLAPLSMAEILRWADLFYFRTGRWPVRHDGPVMPRADETWHETWDTVDSALRVGRRGVRGGSSLARLLKARRGAVYRPPPRLPPLTVPQILRWAYAHHRRTGTWPARFSGRVVDARGETWESIDEALKHGRRGLPQGTLARLLAESGLKPFNAKATPLTEQQIRAWAREHRRRTGRWPTQGSGPVHGARGERWNNLQSSLYKGQRGLPGGSSIARLVASMSATRTPTRRAKRR